MYKKLGILSLVLIYSLSAWSDSFYSPAYKSNAANLKLFISSKLDLLYSSDEDKREDALDKVKAASRQSLREGDSSFTFKILGDYILSIGAPDILGTDEDYRDEIKDLQAEALEFLIDEVEDGTLSISSREYVVQQISRIASASDLPDFDWNEDSMEVLEELSEDDNGVLRHAAIAGVKQVALKTEEKWENLAEDAAEILVRDIDNNDLERQRISYLESIDVLKKAVVNNDATEKMWEVVIDDLDDIESPKMWERITTELSDLIGMKTGAVFEEEVSAAKEELKELESKKIITKEPIEELLELLKEEDDPAEIEAAIDRLLKESRKNRALAYVVYSRITGITSDLEIESYKLRLLLEALIRMTHSIKSSLFYYRTALFFLSEVSIHEKSSKANIPLIMLGNLLSSTDHSSLVLPVLEEIYQFSFSNLPMWIKRRLVTLIFIQAGDSPDKETSLGAAEYITKIAENSNNIALKWEAITRIGFLAKFAKEDAVKTYIANWQ